MNKWIIAFMMQPLLVGCASLPPASQSQAPAAAAAEVKSLEDRLVPAFNTRDSRFLEQVIAPEYVLASSGGPNGTTITHREAWFANWRNQTQLPYEAQVMDVVVVGDTAVATLQARWRRNSFLTDTWARRNGRWQLIFRHSAPRP